MLFADGFRTTSSVAAFVNATAAHGLELDDTHDESITHPGSAVMATAFATATTTRSSAAEILAAIRAGYEVVGRLGAATNAAHIVEHGFHPTSLFAGFGAATAAACLRKLDRRQLLRSWGLVLSTAGGSMQFSQEAVGTTVKRLHGGFAALHGTMAVDLVLLGIEGPERSLEGRYGVLEIFGADTDAARLVTPHSDGPEIHRISFKPYPCCRFFHSTLDALAEVTADFTVDPDTIREIRVGGPDVLATQHVLRRPLSEMAAQYSLPFALGAALLFGPRNIDAYADEHLANPQILAIADRVNVVADYAYEASYPEHFGSWLEIQFVTGESRRSDVLDSLGTPANPMSEADLVDKFDELVAPLNSGLSGEAVVQSIAALTDADSVDRLLAGFAARL
jgi:2-methylcitrate dehydratase PrpD